MSSNLSETDLELMRKQFSANPKNLSLIHI